MSRSVERRPLPTGWSLALAIGSVVLTGWTTAGAVAIHCNEIGHPEPTACRILSKTTAVLLFAVPTMIVMGVWAFARHAHQPWIFHFGAAVTVASGLVLAVGAIVWASA